MNKYAILYAGCINNKYKHSRYGNDLAFMNYVLDKHGYDVKRLYADGERISYNDRDYETCVGSKENFLRSLLELSRISTEDDTVVIVVSNHGNIEGINCWSREEEVITLSELQDNLRTISGKKILIFGQCYGGNFLDLDITNAVIISANEPNQKTIAANSDNYNEFLYHFISYLNGEYPNGTKICMDPSKLDFEAAYKFAYENDSFKDIPFQYKNRIDGIRITEEIYEKPQIREKKPEIQLVKHKSN